MSRSILNSIFVVVAIVFAAATVNGQKNQDVCRVTSSIWSISDGRGTGIYEIGKFPVDDIDDGATKNFTYKDAERVFSFRAEVEYGGDWKSFEKGKPSEIRISLLVVDSETLDTAPKFSAVTAGTSYNHKWGTIYVSKDSVKGDLVYNFELKCSDGISKNGVKRGEPKWMQKTGK